MSSFLHSLEWEQFQQTMGFPTFYDGAGNLFSGRNFGFGKYALSSRCVITKNYELPKNNSSRFLRYEPLTQEDFLNLVDLAAREKKQLVPTVAVQPRQTLILDISAEEEALLRRMKEKHRYNVRLAAKKDVSVEIFSANLIEHFERFWKLIEMTATRQNFRLHHQKYYQNMLEVLEPAKMIHLAFAKDGLGDLATMLLITYEGTATYLHGGSAEKRKEKMAPFLLHFEAMRFAKTLDCIKYDFWGTDARFDEPSKTWIPQTGKDSAGTTRFKLGFGGEIIDYPGCFDLVLQPMWYTAYTSLRALRGSKRSFS